MYIFKRVRFCSLVFLFLKPGSFEISAWRHSLLSSILMVPYHLFALFPHGLRADVVCFLIPKVWLFPTPASSLTPAGNSILALTTRVIAYSTGQRLCPTSRPLLLMPAENEVPRPPNTSRADCKFGGFCIPLQVQYFARMTQNSGKHLDVLIYYKGWASQVVLVIKNPPASVGDIGDVGLIPGFR